MEFKGTNGKWCTEWRNGNHYIHKEKSNIHREYIGQMFYLKNNENTHNLESYYNALLISKAPCFYEDAKNDLDLFDELLKQLPLGLQHLKNAIKERKKEKEQLIKEATEL